MWAVGSICALAGTIAVGWMPASEDRLGKNSGRTFAKATRALGTRIRVLRLAVPGPSMMIAEAALCSARAK
jgi:hypothetical protein